MDAKPLPNLNCLLMAFRDKVLTGFAAVTQREPEISNNIAVTYLSSSCRADTINRGIQISRRHDRARLHWQSLLSHMKNKGIVDHSQEKQVLTTNLLLSY